MSIDRAKLKELMKTATPVYLTPSHAVECDDPHVTVWHRAVTGLDVARFRGPNRVTDAAMYVYLANSAPAILALAERETRLLQQNHAMASEIDYAIESIPAKYRVRVREGGGPECKEATLALSMAKERYALAEEVGRLREERDGCAAEAMMTATVYGKLAERCERLEKALELDIAWYDSRLAEYEGDPLQAVVIREHGKRIEALRTALRPAEGEQGDAR